MEKTVHSQGARNSPEPASEKSRQLSGAGRLAQLTALANQSPRVQAQRKLADDLQHSPRVEAQRHLAAEINAGSPMAAQLKRLEKKPAAQAKGKLDEKNLAQTKLDGPAQAKRKEERLPAQPKIKDREKPRQPKFAEGGAAQLEESAAPNRTGLPDNLKSGVESLSGVSLDQVKVHYNSPKPAQLNALAYAQGSDIHVAPGQQKHLPHEAWHVAQQSQGRVKPTMQTKGVAINDDSSLEHEADVMGAKAATVQAKAETMQAVDKRKKK